MAAAERVESLKRAIRSIRLSSASPVKIIVVVNGDRSDAELMTWLRSEPDIHVHIQLVPSLPMAIQTGRSLVTTRFFSTLDDDDEYLAGSLDARLSELKRTPSADVLITNGYRRTDGKDSMCYRTLKFVPDNPLVALMEIPWLNSANALYRSSTIDIEYFQSSHPYAEWTWLAFNLATRNKRIVAIEQPTFRINDTAGSLSKSQQYELAYENLFKRMLAVCPHASVAKLLHAKLGRHYHYCANKQLLEGDRLGAMVWHLRSLMKPGGTRYLSFTRHLIGWTSRP